MTATTHDIVKRPATNWSPQKRWGGSAAAKAADFSGVTTVNDALDACSEAWKAEHVVTANSIGKASSIAAATTTTEPVAPFSFRAASECD